MTNIQVFHLITLIITGLYMIGGSFVMKTENVISSVIFKFMPFILGLCCLFSAIKIQPWL